MLFAHADALSRQSGKDGTIWPRQAILQPRFRSGYAIIQSLSASWPVNLFGIDKMADVVRVA